MSEFDRDTDTDSEIPTASELLAAAGLDARAIREVLAEAGGRGE